VRTGWLGKAEVDAEGQRGDRLKPGEPESDADVAAADVTNVVAAEG
jgi:hypothetical protein